MAVERIRVRFPFLSLPPTHTCDGPDASPPFELEGVNASSLALMAINPFESCCTHASWIAWNIPPVGSVPPGIPATTSVDEPLPMVQGTNDYGGIGWRGPCPPPGQTQRIILKIWGLDSLLDHLRGGARKDAFISALRGHVVQYGETVVLYSR